MKLYFVVFLFFSCRMLVCCLVFFFFQKTHVQKVIFMIFRNVLIFRQIPPVGFEMELEKKWNTKCFVNPTGGITISMLIMFFLCLIGCVFVILLIPLVGSVIFAMWWNPTNVIMYLLSKVVESVFLMCICGEKLIPLVGSD